ncbi:ABC transporter permease [Myceligenerans pegani]|uniref:ABC transporter permease n=1 Tax=Myceligenerans pegani TaxID=2776917 RepID=A0ABR9N4A4_9MICO|nr:ABC transporter permease [Myceligenerans sp. TRM 65318]MBE1878505.1 ABC transporter permease [Myceligenerans sp. TRM 65318]MBE3020776.1 ABC transporter permease [Myceligenerans sp. TRM 65318]
MNDAARSTRPTEPYSGPSGRPARTAGASAAAPSTATTPAAAPPARRVLTQAAFEARTLLRNGEQLLVSLILPVLVLVGMATAPFLGIATGGASRIDFATPGVLALAVVSSAFTSQAIATAFDRRNGVLRMLATTPLGRSGLLAGKALAVLAVLAVQVAVLSAVAAGLGWTPEPAGLAPAGLALLLGTACFTALAMLLAGTVRAEGVLAVANLVWILLVVGGGLVVPPDRLGPLGPLAAVLPSGALGEAVRGALLDGALPGGPLLILAAWTAGAALAAARWFRWS